MIASWGRICTGQGSCHIPKQQIELNDDYKQKENNKKKGKKRKEMQQKKENYKK